MSNCEKRRRKWQRYLSLNNNRHENEGKDLRNKTSEVRQKSESWGLLKQREREKALYSQFCLCVCVSMPVTEEGLPRSCVHTRWLVSLGLPGLRASGSKAALCCIASPAAPPHRWANIVVWQKGVRRWDGMEAGGVMGGRHGVRWGVLWGLRCPWFKSSRGTTSQIYIPLFFPIPFLLSLYRIL